MKQNSSAMHDKWIIILDYIAFIIHNLTSLRYFSIFFKKNFLLLLLLKWDELKKKSFLSHLKKWSDELYGYTNKPISIHTYSIHNPNMDGFLFVSFYCFRALIRVIVCLVVKKEETGM